MIERLGSMNEDFMCLSSRWMRCWHTLYAVTTEYSGPAETSGVKMLNQRSE